MSRNENLEIGWIPPTGWGALRIAKKIVTLLQDEKVGVLVLTDDGFVYLLDPDSERAAKVFANNVHWILGTYTPQSLAVMVAEDIRDRAREIKGRRCVA